MASTTHWWKRLRCDCFTDDIVRDDHEEYMELLNPHKNDVSHVTESTAGESGDWDEDDILVHDTTTYQSLPQQPFEEKSFLMGMLAPVTGKGVLDFVDMAKAKFMSSSEINYPPSQTGSSLVDYPKVEMPTASSWAKMAATLRARRNKRASAGASHPPYSLSSTRHGRQVPEPPMPKGNNVQHPTGSCLLGISFPHPAYMMDCGRDASPPHKPRYFKTSSNVQHPHEEHVRIAKDDKMVIRL